MQDDDERPNASEGEPTPQPTNRDDASTAQPTPGSTPVPATSRRRSRLGYLLVAAVVVPILLVALAAGGFVTYLDRLIVRNVQQEQLLPTDGPGRRASAGNAENYLLIGSDQRPEAKNSGLADVIIWMHVDKDHKRVDLVHVPRDYYVEIPGHGWSKINEAYSIGGAPLLVQTMQPLVGTRVDHVAVIGFEGFKKMTDTLGGVDVDIPEHVASPQFPAGQRHLNGEEALTFVRERKDLDQQDISRGERQQIYLKTLLLRALSDDVVMDPVKFAKFVDAGTQNLTLDQTFPKEQLRDKAFEMRGVTAENVHFWSAPWIGVGHQRQVGDVVYRNPGLLTELGQHLAEDTMAEYQDEETPRTGFSQTPEQRERTQARGLSRGTASPTGTMPRP